MIYARLMAACGFTSGEIDDLPFCDILGLYSYWEQYPPVNEILKCVYGVERQVDVADDKNSADPSGIGGLITRFPEGFVREG